MHERAVCRVSGSPPPQPPGRGLNPGLNPKCWCRYPPGARRAMVVLRGKDSQFWAGNYGAKFASPSLAFACDGTGAAERAAMDEDAA